MSQNSKLNPNILLTEICNLSCPFCFARKIVSKTQKREMDVRDFQRLLDFLEKNGQTEVRLLGGEPTLHSQFKEIVAYAILRKFKIRLFTNGFFSNELARWMAGKKQSIVYSVNLAATAFASEENKLVVERNLEILGNASKIDGSITVDSADLNKYTSIVALVEKNKFESVRIAIANNTVDNSGSRSVADDYKKVIVAIVGLVDELKKTGDFSLSFNCGFTPCMFERREIKRLLEAGIRLRGWSCQGKAGSFDVTSDLYTFPCYIADELKTAKVFDFKNLGLAKAYNNSLFEYAFRNSSLSTIKKCTSCSFFKRRECRGPCLGYICNNKKEKEKYDNFKKSLRYGFRKFFSRAFHSW